MNINCEKCSNSPCTCKKSIHELAKANPNKTYKELEQERNNRREKISQLLLSRYDRILKAKKGLAVAAVEGSACEGCGSALPPQIVYYVKEKSNLYNCDVCGRFLFWEGEQPKTNN